MRVAPAVLALSALKFIGSSSGSAHAADLPYVNFENNPIHALDLSPDGRQLAIAHTADQRVQLLDVSSAEIISLGHVMVGVDPVSVRWRNANEVWVVNHVSDSISVVDVLARRVKLLLKTADEPFDVVFANNHAFVSCSQVNKIQVFDLNNLVAAPREIDLQAEDPRALAVSPDGRFVYAAIFESGNASTTLQGGLARQENNLANVVSDTRGPYGGRNPPPNFGTLFKPELNPVATPPRVSLIVKRGSNNIWKDDNNGDWTRFVSGELATLTGRVSGWNVVDRDIAVINSATLELRYETGLMNMVMALAVRADGEVSAIGTDASNEVRYEPNLKSRFVRSQIARINGSEKRVSDLNAQLDGLALTLPATARRNSLGDPRAMVWNREGSKAFLAGMGSNNVVVIDRNGNRVGNAIAVGEGPSALALQENLQRLLVWNHFAASLSIVDLNQGREVSQLAIFNPLPEAIKQGRKFLYDTKLTSGQGQASCASCHVDARMDRLAWDLGDPESAPAPFDQNCVTSRVAPCQPFHGMKGPMMTQTMQDIIGHEPLHWRGDRKSIEAFNSTFTALLGNDRVLRDLEMAQFKAYLSTITFPPNPYRNPDNSLPDNLSLKGQRASGRFAMRGTQLPNGNAKRGLQLYTRDFLDSAFQCAACHTLPTGMAPNGPILASILAVPVGTTRLPLGPMGENHLGVVSTDGFSNVSMKVPQTRNMHEKVGAEFSATESLSGFGFAHDGSIGSMADFFSASLFSPQSDQDIADLVALNMAFSGSEFELPNPTLSAPAPLSKDSHAGFGLQTSVNTAALSAQSQVQLNLAIAKKLDLIVNAAKLNFYFDADTARFIADDDQTLLTLAQLQALGEQVWTSVGKGLGRRLALDRDGDGVGNTKEINQGSNPADAASKSIRALSGMWFNPARSGHGFDLQYAGQQIFATWFTYDNNSLPVWYQAAAPFTNTASQQRWRAPLNRFVWNPSTQRAVASEVGELTMTFSAKNRGQVDWRIGSASGSESIQPLIADQNPVFNRSGNWYAPTQSGWGLGVYTQGNSNFTVMYFYDAEQQPRWVFGQGGLEDQVSLSMIANRGACPQCAYSAPTNSAAGNLQLRFSGTRALNVSTDVFSNATPNARWQRENLALEALSAPAQVVEWN